MRPTFQTLKFGIIPLPCFAPGMTTSSSNLPAALNLEANLKHVYQYIADPVFETEKNIRCCMIDLWCIVQIIHYKSIKIEIFITGSIHKFQICDERQAWIRIMITSNNVWFSNQRKMIELMSQNEHPKHYLTFWF